MLGAFFLIAPFSGSALAEAPSTFGTTIGSALLCLDQIDPFYFWSYLNEFFGAPYKKEGGAYWFKVQTSLWGATISDVMVSDGSGQLMFLAAAASTKPDKLSEAIISSTGIGYTKNDTSQYSPMMSNLGSKIVFFNQNSKIYCAKHNPNNNRWDRVSTCDSLQSWHVDNEIFTSFQPGFPQSPVCWPVYLGRFAGRIFRWRSIHATCLRIPYRRLFGLHGILYKPVWRTANRCYNNRHSCLIHIRHEWVYQPDSSWNWRRMWHRLIIGASP